MVQIQLWHVVAIWLIALILLGYIIRREYRRWKERIEASGRAKAFTQWQHWEQKEVEDISLLKGFILGACSVKGEFEPTSASELLGIPLEKLEGLLPKAEMQLRFEGKITDVAEEPPPAPTVRIIPLPNPNISFPKAFCHKCGLQNTVADAKYCIRCGVQL